MRFKSSPTIYVSLFCTLVVLSVNMACQKKKETSSLSTETTTTVEHPFFNKNVGGPIDSSIANQWKRNMTLTLSKKASSAVTTTTFYLPAAALRNLVAADKVA